MHIEIGEKIASKVTLTEGEISEFARMCGDKNPLHSDKGYASQTRFGGIIACGPHYASLLMGLSATHFSKTTAMLGLEFSFRFPKPVRAGETLDLQWEVVAVVPKASLGGEIVSLEGKITNQQGIEVLIATGKVLVTPHL